MSKDKSLKRRTFLKKSAAGVVGAGIASSAAWSSPAEEKPSLKIKDYRVLGRTGFEVSDLGGGYIQDPGLISALLDTGVNYLDTAESYPGHHRTLSEVIKKRDRKSLFITSKMEMTEDISTEGLIKRVRKCLEELGTEYVDCMMMHCPEKVETLGTKGFHEAMKQLKTEGRVRFVGVSHHGSFWMKAPEETMEAVLLAAAEDGRFDVFLLAYNFLQMDRAERVLEACKEKQIGTALMKTTPVAKYYTIKSRVEQLEQEGKEVNEFYREGLERYKAMSVRAEQFIEKHRLENPDEIKEAAIRFVLENPNVHTVCCSLTNFDELDRAIRLSGTRLSEWEKSKLARFEEGFGRLYCRHGCGLCEPVCPHSVPVNTILRYNHYFEAQGREKYAMSRYAEVPGARADRCRDCAGPCESACPYGVPVRGMMAMAHRQLSVE